MKLRITAFALAAATLLVHLLFARPTRAAVEEGEGLYEQTRRTRASLHARLLELEHLQGRRNRPTSVDEALPLREAIVASLAGRSLRNVHIALTPQGTRMIVSISGEGSLREALQLVDDVLGPRVGVTPRRFRLSPGATEVSFSLDGDRLP